MVKKFTDIMLKAYYDRSVTGRMGLHRSDAISCPLRAYWRITKKIEGIYNSTDVGILLLGELAHIALHKNFDAQEKQFTIGDYLHVTVDAIFGDFPIETKTTRKKVYRREDLPQAWLEQLAIAMSVMKVNKGYLMVLNIISFNVSVWELEMCEEERTMFMNNCIWQILSILDAIQKEKPELLTPKVDECEYCPYRPMKVRTGCQFYVKPAK
jgi:CRISPR/Cas system-associated exonuclease Cas4 (RecB family)